MVGYACVDVEVVEVALNVDIRSPGAAARRVIDDQPRRVKPLAQVVHLRDPRPIIGAQWQPCTPILVDNCPAVQRWMVEIAPDHLGHRLLYALLAGTVEP